MVGLKVFSVSTLVALLVLFLIKISGGETSPEWFKLISVLMVGCALMGMLVGFAMTIWP